MEAGKLARIAWILAALHAALALGYALVTPYREGGYLRFQGRAYAADIGAPDERQHANYVRHLANGEGFPVLNTDPSAPGAYENYQAHQPPSFYVLGSLVARVGGLDLETRAGGLALRFLNCLIGAGGVLGVFYFALWGLRKPEIAVGAAAFAALLPMNAALSGAISNDPLLFALGSWTLALAARALREGFTLKGSLGIGLMMGLGFLTKTTAIALWPAVAFGIYTATKQTPSPFSSREKSEGAGSEGSPAPAAATKRGKKFEEAAARTDLVSPATAALLALALPILMAAPWWLRNQQLYGDPLAMKAFSAAFVGSPQAAEFIKIVGPVDYWITGAQSGTGVVWWTLRSFFGAFGYMDIFYPSGLYAALSAGLLAVLAGRYLARGDSDLAGSSAVRAMGAVLFTVVLALFLRFNAQYFQGQARYLLPAIAPIAATIGIGVWGLARKRPAVGIASLALILVALDVYTLVRLPSEFDDRLGPPPIAGRGP